jgi:4-hydroxy-tetrahydrodipicolinate reductase
MSFKVAIAGVGGRMGRSLLKAADEFDGIDIVGGTERPSSNLIGQDLGRVGNLGKDLHVPTSLAVEDAAKNADVWVDFTAPESTLEALQTLIETNVKAAIIGTTGFTAEQEKQLAEFGTKIAIVKAGNFSFGVNLVNALIEQAAQRLGDDWDIEILETHHRRKVDAPSGTALMMGEAAANGRGKPLDALRTAPYDGITGEREAGKIGFSVRRSGGVIGDHETTFAAEDEIVSIRHTAMDRSIFANGALKAGAWAIQKSPGYYSMRDVLDL